MLLEDLSRDVARVREDVGYIRGRLEAEEALMHERRISKIERWVARYGYPVSGLSAVAAIVAAVVAHA